MTTINTTGNEHEPQGPTIEVRDASRRYGGSVVALDQVSFSVAPGEWLALSGPSGSGKTTLLNLLDGLDRPTDGAIDVAGIDVASLSAGEAAVFRREYTGLVFQQFHMVPYLTALENVMLAQYYHSMTDREEALAALESVGMGERATHLPAQLSGGEQQRVCIARALVNDPPIVLADEPTGNLDEENERIVLEIFRTLHARGKTLIVATHSRTWIEAAGRRIRLEHGRVVDDSGASQNRAGGLRAEGSSGA